MKKLIKISSVILAVGVILSLVGFIFIRRDNVKAADVYAIAEDSLSLNEEGFEYEPPEPADIKGTVKPKNFDDLGVQLNEFNTLNIYAKGCDVELGQTGGDRLYITVYECSVNAGIKGGTLYIQVISDNNDAELTVGIPDDYKGGFSLGFDGCRVRTDSFESAMDMGINLNASQLNAGSLSADNIEIKSGSSSLDLRGLYANDSLSVSVLSGEVKLGAANSPSIDLLLGSCTASVKNISGSMKANMQKARLDAVIKSVEGGITLELNGGAVNLKVPKGAPLDIDHNETYGYFTDKTTPAQNGGDKTAQRYTMETNIKYGIVTLENLQ